MRLLPSAGRAGENLVFSRLHERGTVRRGANAARIDPCFPSKLGIPHVHDLLYVQHAKTPLDAHLLPDGRFVPDLPEHAAGHRACPTVVATPEAAHAAFIKEGDLFAQKGIVFKKTFLNMDQPAAVRPADVRRLEGRARPVAEETERAVEQGLRALADVRDRSAAERARSSISSNARTPRHGRAGAAVPQRSGRQPRDLRGTAEARVPDLLAGHAADR